MTNTEQDTGALRVALVASDDALRSSVRLLLTVCGMQVDDYRTARQLHAARPASYACLVVDCRLSDMQGSRLCSEVIRLAHAVPVVVLSASPGVFDFARIARPNVRVVEKPFPGELLVDTIRQAAGGLPDHGEGNGTPPQARPAAS